MVHDILDLSKIEAGYFSYNNTTFNLVDLFSELEMLFRYKMHSGVEFCCDTPSQGVDVYFDRIRVSQIMTNAIKFTSQGKIRMGYEILENSVRLFVEDTGIGMTQDQVKRVFERFEKFNKFEQGTGLGTSIAKAIVETYQGKIGAYSVSGQVSLFWAILLINIEAAAGLLVQ